MQLSPTRSELSPAADAADEFIRRFRAARREPVSVQLWTRFSSPVIGIGLFAVVLLCQLWVGAYRAELNTHPDETAHFMNGLLVRDYLLHGLGQHPIRFAEDFYLHYPKIAPAIWPPLFHVVLGVVLLPGWSPQVAALVLLALVTTWTAWRLSRMVETVTSPVGGVTAATLFVVTPLVADLTSTVMLDMVLAAFALEAAYRLARFWQSGTLRDGVLFGVLGACCCLTKGNGLAMAFMPPLLMLFAPRWPLLRRPGLYVAALIVVVLAAPFLVVSYRLDHAIGDFGPVTPGVVVMRLQYYAAFLWRQFGVLALLAIWALVAATGAAGQAGEAGLTRGRSKAAGPPLVPAMKALVLAALAFHLVNPHQVNGGRYLALAMAPFLGLIVIGVYELIARLLFVRSRPAVQWVALAALVVVFAATKPALALRRPGGYRDAVAFLQSRGGIAGSRVLIVSNEMGEGAFVSEAAMSRPVPAATVIRGSKLLGTDDWNGHGFSLRHASWRDLLHDLEDLHVDYLVFDSAKTGNAPYRDTINTMLERAPSRFQWVGSTGLGSPVSIYQLRFRSAGPPAPLRIDLTHSLGRVLEQ